MRRCWRISSTTDSMMTMMGHKRLGRNQKEVQQQKERYPVDVMSDEEELNRDDPDVEQKRRQARQRKKVWQ